MPGLRHVSGRLPGRLRRLARGCHALLVLPVCLWVEWAVRRRPLPWVARRLGVGLDLSGDDRSGGDRPVLTPGEARGARAVARVFDRWPREGTCLRRALVLGFVLRRHQPALRIGVRPTPGGGVVGHAWLVVDGATLDPEATRYDVLSR